ncbi:MAG: hypothetical protein AAGD13_00665 [Pseudomonadota bacterium]
MREAIEINAEGRRKRTWPETISICNWARAFQKPPASVSPMITRYMRSAPGQAAFERLDLEAVALFLYLRRVGRPPMTPSAWASIDRHAGEMADRRAFHALEPVTGRDQAALEDFAARVAFVRGLVYPSEKGDEDA